MANIQKGVWFDPPAKKDAAIKDHVIVEREQTLVITVGKASAEIINGAVQKWDLGDGLKFNNLKRAVESAQILLAEVVAATGEEGAPSPYVIAAAPAMRACLTQVRDGLASWSESEALREEMIRHIDHVLFRASGDEVFGQGEEVNRK